jgi:hypothetical protein
VSPAVWRPRGGGGPAEGAAGSAIRGASSQRVARTLARLRDLDLIEQPRPRHWQIADPLLSAALDPPADS